MKNRVILQHVADKAGVHLTTAARAMKNDPRVRPETLARVQQVAQELGYAPDPMLSALSTYRTQSRPTLYHGTVGWITNYPSREGWQHESFRLYRQGATEGLARHGYRLEDFWLQEPGLSAKRAGQILQNRGIRGLLVCPLPIACGHLDLKWEKFASVTFGYSLVRPEIDLVTTSHYQNMQICIRNLHHLGYHRLGFVTWYEISRRVLELWTAAYRTPAFTNTTLIPILDLKVKDGRFTDFNKGEFFKWFDTHRPDAILVVDQHILSWLQERGCHVPGEVAYVSPSLQNSNVTHAGVLEPSLEIGRCAGDFLVGKLNRGEFGIPATPRRILLDGRWQPGMTVENRRKS